jgi:hypothetical protein
MRRPLSLAGRFGAAAFVFFFVKGLVWLAVAGALALGILG